MTEEQQRFFDMLKPYDRFSYYWNPEERSLDIDKFSLDLNLMSSGERRMAMFFASLWFGESDDFLFDLIESIRILDANGRRTIINWLKDPFYP